MEVVNEVQMDVVNEVQIEEDVEEDTVKKVTIDGKKYLKSKKTGVLYDYDKYINEGDQIIIGTWNQELNKIDYNDEYIDEFEELEEDHYD